MSLRFPVPHGGCPRTVSYALGGGRAEVAGEQVFVLHGASSEVVAKPQHVAVMLWRCSASPQQLPCGVGNSWMGLHMRQHGAAGSAAAASASLGAEESGGIAKKMERGVRDGWKNGAALVGAVLVGRRRKVVWWDQTGVDPLFTVRSGLLMRLLCGETAAEPLVRAWSSSSSLLAKCWQPGFQQSCQSGGKGGQDTHTHTPHSTGHTLLLIFSLSLSLTLSLTHTQYLSLSSSFTHTHTRVGCV
jgi:hypothetical protein